MTATVLPMFPLGSVLFPYAPLPLHVFEARYRLMIQRVMQGDREFGVVLIERGSEVGGGDTRFEIGTVARVVRAAELPDGRYALSTVGIRRVEVVRWLADDPYPQAQVEPLVDDPAEPDDDRRRARVIEVFGRVVDVSRRVDPSIGELPAFAADPARAAYEIAALAPIGPLDAQRVLAAPSVSARLDLLESSLVERIDELEARLRMGE